MRLFEKKCRSLRHRHCLGCRMVSLNINVNSKGFCESCCRRKDRNFLLNKRLLPIWYKDDSPQYRLPPELLGLTIAEQMLIQRVSPFVPLHHIKNGVFGLSGHVCAFEQDITGMADTLPRLPRDTTVLRVLQEIKTEIGSQNIGSTKVFKVRRHNVLVALRFLCSKSKEYVDIKIDESRLDWLEGEEGDLDSYAVDSQQIQTRNDDDKSNADMGPCSRQCVDPQRLGENVQAFGYIEDDGPALLSPEDSLINQELQAAVAASPNKQEDEMEWPSIAETPISEYDDVRIFTRAFPWLFPGGYGDIMDFDNPDANLSSWAKRLLYYEDGRFAKDKLFCFFAMNYIVRRRNNSSGKFFIDNFQSDVPDTLDELKDRIRAGDMRFVNHLTYYNKRIKGSAPYWFQKRSEVYAWINEHIQQQNGAPTFFITLSCAEYFWADVIDLLRDRFTHAGLDPRDCHVGSPKLIQIVNDYTIVIQEYFQRRTEIWLDTVGKLIFDIKHYWARYEFAPGRGQIHCHLLAIPNSHAIFEECHKLLQTENGEEK